MIDVKPSQYLENYAELRAVIEHNRVKLDEESLKPFAFKLLQYEDDDNLYDDHASERMGLILALSEDFCAEDRPLIRWFIRENTKLYSIGNDISQETTLCAFMLYKYMTKDDILLLYACKFAYGSSEQHAVDTEIALGLGLQETLTYLQQHPDIPNYQDMKNALQAYCANGAKFKPRAEFIEFFEKRRFAYWQEQLADCYGFIDLSHQF